MWYVVKGMRVQGGGNSARMFREVETLPGSSHGASGGAPNGARSVHVFSEPGWCINGAGTFYGQNIGVIAGRPCQAWFLSRLPGQGYQPTTAAILSRVTTVTNSLPLQAGTCINKPGQQTANLAKLSCKITNFKKQLISVSQASFEKFFLLKSVCF